jgi:hypothetical protein
MINDLINQHKGEISSLLKEKFNVGDQQSNDVSDTILSNVTQLFGNKNFDISQISDLFNANTSNTANPLFASLSQNVAQQLKEKGYNNEMVESVSNQGLDSIISKVSAGGLSNLDIGSLLGNLGKDNNILDSAKDILGGLFK